MRFEGNEQPNENWSEIDERLYSFNARNERKCAPSSNPPPLPEGGGVKTRGQKRRRGERDVWDLIVNNDDVSFQHILPGLNATDVKFLYGVNTETRKMIKRSSRAEDLKKTFKVSEMSSISTLEFTLENKSLWPRGWRKDEWSFC